MPGHRRRVRRPRRSGIRIVRFPAGDGKDAAEQHGLSEAEARRIIRKNLADQSFGMKIVSVAVTEDKDGDGEPVLHVTVVHDTNPGRNLIRFCCQAS